MPPPLARENIEREQIYTDIDPGARAAYDARMGRAAPGQDTF